jgi:hypothetical protein
MFSMGFCGSAHAKIIEFDVPGSAGTLPTAINSSGYIIGQYADNAPYLHSFLRSPNGAMTNIDVVGATCGSGIETGTAAMSINRSGTITGYEADANCTVHGFVRAPDGQVTIFDPADAVQTRPASINKEGAVAGSYLDNKSAHGFLRTSDGTITTFDPAGSTYTFVAAINATGTIVGTYTDSKSRVRGFLRTADGAIAVVNVRKAARTYANGLTTQV